MMSKRTWVVAAALISLVVSSATYAAKDAIVFSTAPTDTPDATRKLYNPLMNYLAQATGVKFVIEPAQNYVEYSNKLRAGAYDMLFDGPHFTGWRMERMGAVPLARLPGDISIVVVVRADSTVSAVGDLVGVRVCSFASPNMLTMDFLSYFPNPARQPILVREQGFKEVTECLRSGKGDAAVLRDKVWAKQDQNGLKVLAEKYRSYPERTFSVSKDVDPALREKIAAALLSEEGQKAAAPILAAFKKDKLIPADPKVYDGLGNLLSPVWGFQ